MKNLKDKVVVITGAASGIGKALAQQFAKLGSHLALNDFNEEGLLETVKELQSITSGKVFSASFDVSKVENIDETETGKKIKKSTLGQKLLKFKNSKTGSDFFKKNDN